MIDIIVSISIMGIFVLVAFNVAQKSILVSRQAVRSAQAAFLLEEGAESIKIFRDNNTWANFTTFFNTASTYCLSGDIPSWTSALPTTTPCTKIDNFTRVINVADVNRDISSGDIVASGGTLDSGTRLFTVTVSWPEGGSTITKTLRFYTSNIFLQ